VSEITRFAPSPTGWLHLGHAFAALFAEQAGDRLLLRIEDLDQTRARRHFIAGICEDLAWLGVEWEQPLLCQSSRTDAYLTALARLTQQGVTYPCFCTRREIALEFAHAIEAPRPGEAGSIRYGGTCRQLPLAERARRLERGDPHAVRLDSAKAAAFCGDMYFDESGCDALTSETRVKVDPILFGDIVLARKGLPAAYHLAVVIDDAFQHVTLVTRGVDLALATHTQVTLQRMLGLPTPAYRHHRLILDETNRKLSKSRQSTSLRSLRESGATAARIRQQLGFS
jgi:glutamyl-Q tRNA(Asp) synthetase